MNLVAKIRIMLADIEALKAKVEKLERIHQQISDCDALVPLGRFPSKPAPGVEIIKGPVQVYESTWPPLSKAIVDDKPIASATIAPPPKKRGRPPKA